jgi:hypothetical protein
MVTSMGGGAEEPMREEGEKVRRGLRLDLYDESVVEASSEEEEVASDVESSSGTSSVSVSSAVMERADLFHLAYRSRERGEPDGGDNNRMLTSDGLR